jgi:hypothetical protein
VGRAGTPAAKRAEVAERRTNAISLRQAGVDLVSIGRQLRYGRWEQAEDGSWTQLSSDDNVARMVRQDIDRGLADRRKHLNTASDELVTSMVERLERLRAALWPQAVKGTVGAVREAARIEAQLAHLQGLNKPVKHEVDLTAAQRQVQDAVAELIALAQSDPSIDLSLALPSGVNTSGEVP